MQTDPATPQVSVVLPTLNERGSLPSVVAAIHAALNDVAHEIIVVDDDSTDGTWQWVEHVMAQDPRLRLVRRRTIPDLSEAVLEGFRVARSDCFIVMDADGQHDPALLPAMHHTLASHELVVASRYLPGGGIDVMTAKRLLGGRGARWLAQLLLNVPLSDPMAGFFGIHRETYTSVATQMNPRGYKILLELYVRLTKRPGTNGVNVAELPIRFRARIAGRSKLSRRIVWQYLAMVIKLWREDPWGPGLLQFLLVGAMGVLVNCATLWVFVRHAHWHYLLGGAVAIQLSVLHNFVWHDHWTFRSLRPKNQWVMRLGRYELSTFGGLLLNWFVLAILVGWARLPLLFANLCGIALGTLLNFSLSKLWVWSRPQRAGMA